MLHDFHFLRPLWLLLLIPAAWLVVRSLRPRGTVTDSAWSRLVDPHLLAALSVGGGAASRPSRWLSVALGAGLAAATLAMAGPAWQRIEQPTWQARAPVVVDLSLAQSMNAGDITPSRLTRAGHKLRDILDRQQGGDIGLVIYSDRPFVAAPLTGDAEVIRQMLPELSTDLMPTLGNRPDLAIRQSAELLGRANAGHGRIVLLADSAGTDPDAAVAAARAAHKEGYVVDVLGIGTDAGAVLQTASGRAITTRDGQTMQAGFDAEGLRRIAEAGGGAYVALTADGTDIARLLPDSALEAVGAKQSQDFKADQWADMGYWLLLVPVLLAPLAFRRNLFFALPLALGLMAGLGGGRAEAADLKGLWKTPDQQAADAFAAADYASAAERFQDESWRAAALYRAGDYAAAAGALAGSEAAGADYNRGNALAKSGDLKGALEAYDAALKLQPDNADAQFNRDLVEKLLQQQQQQQQQQQDQQQQQQAGGQGQDQQPQQGGGQDQNQQQQQAGDQGQGNDQSQGQNGQQQQAGNQNDPQSSGGGQGQQPDQQQAGAQSESQPQSGDQQAQAQPQPAGQRDSQDKGQDQSRQAAGQSREQGEDQAGQQQAAGQSGAGEEQSAAPQQTAAAQGQDQPAPAPQTDQQASAGSAPSEAESDAFKQAMDAALDGGTGQQPTDQQPTASASGAQPMTEQQQANEQMLRAVPDDASGLLRARIRQYYAQTR